MSLLDRLRSETRVLHAQVERLTGLLAADLDRARYRRTLRALYGVVASCERTIPAYGPSPADWIAGDRRKAGFLKADLAELGSDLPAECPDGPWQAGRDAVHMGCMYVIEGSTLGGRVLLNRLSASTKPFPTRYFQSYGASVRPMWTAFCLRLESKFAPEQHGQVIEGARGTFRRLAEWLQCPEAAT